MQDEKEEVKLTSLEFEHLDIASGDVMTLLRNPSRGIELLIRGTVALLGVNVFWQALRIPSRTDAEIFTLVHL